MVDSSIMSVSAIGMMRVQLQLEGQILKEDDFDVLDNRVDVRSVRETFKVETLRLIAEVRQGGELYKHSPKGIVMRSDARGFSVRAFPGVTAIVVSGEGKSNIIYEMYQYIMYVVYQCILYEIYTHFNILPISHSNRAIGPAVGHCSQWRG